MPALRCQATTALWHELVNEAQAVFKDKLGEEEESYLVFLLMRFTEKPEVAESVLALDFLMALEETGKLRSELLRDVGDKCLLFSGLFPNHAERRRVNVSYFVDLGQLAYGTLCHSKTCISPILFKSLSKNFVAMMDVLQALRTLRGDGPQLQPLEAIDLWQHTGSRQAYLVLSQITDGSLIQAPNSKWMN